MTDKNFFEELSENQKAMSSRIFDLVLSRVLKNAYACFDKKTKERMDKIFLSDDDASKEKFMKDNIPDFEKLFEEEASKIEEEIKIEIGKEI